MRIDQVAVQLYTLREFIQTPGDIAATLRKVRAIGYRAVQVSGMGPIEEEELVRILDGEGLVLCATHEAPDRILNEPERVVERLKRLGCTRTAYPAPRDVDFSSGGAVDAWIEKLNAAGKVLHESGLRLGYHNHHFEFRRLGGRTILERIYEQTDARYLRAELDTYWVQFGGGDPVKWCARLRGRLPVLHLKDYVIDRENRATFAEIGNGNLDFPAIIAEAERAGCEWYVVEQDICPGDPFESIRVSFEYLRDRTACSAAKES